MRSRILLFVLGLVLVPLLTYFVILFARGYRPSQSEGGRTTLQATGILAATSLPEGAQLYVNGEFKSATDTNLNLPPGTYAVEIKKETYQSWSKILEIKAEEVSRAHAVLFPSVPTLKAITQASLPTLSPDGTKVVFVSQSKLYTLDLTESPLGLLNRDPKLVQGSGFRVQGLVWSPDAKQILAVATGSAQLIDPAAAGVQSIRTIASPSGVLAGWDSILSAREAQKFSTLPPPLQDILATAAADLVWSARENKLLYTATASAVIPDQLKRPLPGSSTQPQERALKPNAVYVYDLEEDKNFKLEIRSPKLETNSNFRISNFEFRISNPSGLSWFPDSNHLIYSEKDKVTILEYDGGNPTVVYQGPMESGIAFPYPSGKQLLILARLKSGEAGPLLYAVSLR